MSNPSNRQSLASLEEALAASVDLITAATRSIEIFSPDLEPDIYNRPEWLERLGSFLTAHSKTRARILTQSTRRAITDGHGLIELSRRLSSHLQIRKTAPEHKDHVESFLIVDGASYLWRPNSALYPVSRASKDRAGARKLLSFFDHAWEHGIIDREFSRLHI